MKRFVLNLLTNYARQAVERYQPTVIGITGSQGKTSVRLAATRLLEDAGRSVRTPKKNYNNEFGFPLGILGLGSAGRSSMGWLRILFQARRIARGKDKNFPKTLILEYGIDKKGDMDHLLSIAQPTIAVVTGVSTIHAVGYENVAEVAEEKMKLARAVPKHGLVVLNADETHLRERMADLNASILTYGFSADADAHIVEMHFVTRPDDWFGVDETAAELNITVKGAREIYALSLKNMAGRPVASTAAAVIALGEHLGLDVVDLIASLSKMSSVPGRMSLLPGIKGTLILDDSYNASPAAVRAAIETLADFDPQEGARRIAVLGSMAELGRYTEDEHRHVGFMVAEMGIDILLCVGEAARDIARSAEEAGMKKETVHEFETSVAAGRWLDQELRRGDIVLVKGSQSSRMEKAVKDIMAEPLRAGELLVRQDARWLET
ncbi:TPA: hypothetical protein DDZ10_01785 [Candidatus Uhrbacteria bacterium]|nr:hypothetical protein [Candidatus Uhrbacteria bacterium]